MVIDPMCTSECTPLRRTEATGDTFSKTTPNLPTNIVDFRGFDSSIIFILRGGTLMSIGNFPESLSRAMLVGTMLIGRLAVPQGCNTMAHATQVTPPTCLNK